MHCEQLLESVELLLSVVTLTVPVSTGDLFFCLFSLSQLNVSISAHILKFETGNNKASLSCWQIMHQQY